MTQTKEAEQLYGRSLVNDVQRVEEMELMNKYFMYVIRFDGRHGYWEQQKKIAIYLQFSLTIQADLFPNETQSDEAIGRYPNLIGPEWLQVRRPSNKSVWIQLHIYYHSLAVSQ